MTRESFWDDDAIGAHHSGAGFAELTSAEMVAMGSGRQKGQVMQLLRRAGHEGLTHWQVTQQASAVLGYAVSHTGYGATINGLMRAGWVLPTGRISWDGPYGKPEEFWVAIPPGGTPIPVPKGFKRPVTHCAHEHLGATYSNGTHWLKDCIDCGLNIKKQERMAS